MTRRPGATNGPAHATPGVRLLVAASVVFILILGVALLLVHQNAGIMRKQIEDDFNQQQLILARQAAAQIDADLRDIQVELSTLAHHQPDVDARFRTYGLTALLEHTSPKGAVAAGLVDARGKVTDVRLAADVTLAPLALSVRRCAEATGTMLSKPLQVVELGADSAVVKGVLCQPLAPGQAGPAIFLALDVTRLVARATREIRSGRTGYAWVIDETGTFLAHPEADFLGRNAFEARKEREPYISFNEINRIMQERMLLGEEGMGTYVSGWHRGAHGTIPKLIAYSPARTAVLAPGAMWSVAVVAPTTEVADAVQRFYPRQLAAQATLVVGIFALGLLALLYQRGLSHSLAREKAQQESFMASILRSSLDAIVFVNDENRIRVWNRGAERIFGYTSEEMLGQTFHRLIPPEMAADEELRRIREEAESRGYYTSRLVPRITKNGRRITVDFSRTTVHSDEGQLIGSTVIVRDMTEKVEWEQRIYNTEKLASIGNLAAGVAHEINNPLAIMLGFTDLLLERFEPGSQEHEDLKVIAENGNSARKIVESLLGFARITEGLEDTVDVKRCIEIVLSLVKNTLMTAKVEYRAELPSDLPRVCGDAREFQQVLFNLINNAVAAMRPGGGALTIGASATETLVLITITDTGMGIPDRIKPRVWDPFFTTKNVGEGTGLGLSLCYGIVTKYGGRIRFTSRSPEDTPEGPFGTTFEVGMPVCHTEELMAPMPDPRNENGSGETR